MSIATLNRVNTLSSFLEASDNLRDIIRVDVAKSKLSILIVFSDSVDMTLRADKEAEVVAARNSLYLNLATKWHLHRVAQLLTSHSKRPGKGLTILTSCKSKVTSGCKRAHLEVVLGEVSQSCRLEYISIVTKTELTTFITTPDKQVICVRIIELHHATIFNGENSLSSGMHFCLDCHRILASSEFRDVNLGVPALLDDYLI